MLIWIINALLLAVAALGVMRYMWDAFGTPKAEFRWYPQPVANDVAMVVATADPAVPNDESAPQHTAPGDHMLSVPESTSLDFIQGVIERQIDSQERRVQSMEQRAGVLLGFSGLLIGLVFADIERIGGCGLAGAGAAAIAGGFAAAVIFPNSAGLVGPSNLMKHYVGADLRTTQLRTLMTFSDIFDEEEHRVERKALLLEAALALVPVAGALLIIGATLETAERNEQSQGDLDATAAFYAT